MRAIISPGTAPSRSVKQAANVLQMAQIVLTVLCIWFASPRVLFHPFNTTQAWLALGLTFVLAAVTTIRGRVGRAMTRRSSGEVPRGYALASHAGTVVAWAWFVWAIVTIVTH